MYATCLFCHSALGANQVIEPFPVGRRLAFDADKGRLWVVCGGCGRWNLTPLEERWEAIEECERRFRDTRLRVSTEHIGLARLREGLELVRVGQPQRPEMAAWRYGREFLRRRLRYGAPASAIGIGAFATGWGIMNGLFLGPVAITATAGGFAAAYVLRHGVLPPRLLLEDGRVVPVWRRHLAKARIIAGEDGGWRVSFRHSWNEGAQLSGAAGRRAAAVILARVNRGGGTAAEVTRSVEHLERLGDPDAVFSRIAAAAGHGEGGTLATLPRDIALGLEMAAHEETERRAMEGELAMLEREWQAAEEVARIADELLVPDAVLRRLAAARRESSR